MLTSVTMRKEGFQIQLCPSAYYLFTAQCNATFSIILLKPSYDTDDPYSARLDHPNP